MQWFGDFMDWVAQNEHWRIMYFVTAVLLATGATLCYNMVMRRKRTGDRKWRWTDEIGLWCMILAKLSLFITVYGQMMARYNS